MTAPKTPLQQHTSAGYRAEKPEQLKMFMSTREIEARWQPLDGDRQEVYGGGGETRTGGTLPESQYATDRLSRKNWYTPGGRERAWTTGGDHLSRSRVIKEDIETDEELWDRKADEAYDPEYSPLPAKRANSFTLRPNTTGGRSNVPMSTDTANTYGQPQGTHFRHDYETTLGESIEREGVKYPVHLGQKKGSQGKPQVVGGHHRMAVMRNLNQDQLIPVLHHQDLMHARSSSDPWGGYR